MQKVKDAMHSLTGGSSERERQAGVGGHHHLGTGADGTSAATGTEYTGGMTGGPAYGSTATGYSEGTGPAYGTTGTGYSEGTETGIAQVPVAQTTNASMPAMMGTERRQGEAATCAQEYFTKVEDRPVVKERIDLIKEHVPVEKEFVVETRATGVEREVGGGQIDHLGTTEQVVAVTPPKGPCE